MDSRIAATQAGKTRRAAAPKAGPLRRDGVFESERFYSYQLSFLNRLRARTKSRAFERTFGITPMEWRILVQLEYRSPSKIADIHARSLIQKPQLSSAMPGLIRKGCIVRVNDPKDARAPDFAITANGLQIYRRVLKASRKRQKGLEALLTRQERLGFEAALKRLTEFYRGEMQLGRDGLFLDGADVADI